MRRAAAILGMLGFALWATAMSYGQASAAPATQTPAAQAPAAPAQPAAKRPPQAKTQPEYDAWKAASANTEPAALEKASDDFATKFPDSELRVLLYKNAMRLYQRANNAEKTEAMGRKVLGLDGDDPEALTTVAEVIAERTRDTDVDKDQRYDEGMKMAQKALQTVDTDVSVPAGTPQDKLDAYKAGLRSQAYSTMGAIDYNKGNFASAQVNFEKAIDAVPSDPYSLDILRLALSLDKQEKYPEALKVVSRVVEMTKDAKDNDPIAGPARRELERLEQLTGSSSRPAATEADFPFTFSVKGTSTASSDHWCIMTLTDHDSVYHVYSKTFQCQPFSVGAEVKGRHTTYPLGLQIADALELMYYDKGKLKSETYIVESREATH